MNDSAQELKKTRRKICKYYRAYPGADRLPDALAQELEDRTRDYVAYQISDDRKREAAKERIKTEIALLVEKYMDSLVDLDFTWTDTISDKSEQVTGIEIIVSENWDLI